jgi:hypothetical protein
MTGNPLVHIDVNHPLVTNQIVADHLGQDVALV